LDLECPQEAHMLNVWFLGRQCLEVGPLRAPMRALGSLTESPPAEFRA
jgi:hypothetical protein